MLTSPSFSSRGRVAISQGITLTIIVEDDEYRTLVKRAQRLSLTVEEYVQAFWRLLIKEEHVSKRKAKKEPTEQLELPFVEYPSVDDIEKERLCMRLDNAHIRLEACCRLIHEKLMKPGEALEVDSIVRRFPDLAKKLLLPILFVGFLFLFNRRPTTIEQPFDYGIPAEWRVVPVNAKNPIPFSDQVIGDGSCVENHNLIME